MAHCAICGDSDRDDPISAPVRFWAPDDGWVFGRLCNYCLPDRKRKPQASDYAYELRHKYVADIDDAIDVIYG